MDKGPASLDELISIPHAATLLQVSRQNLHKAIHRGHLRSQSVEEGGKTVPKTTVRWLQNYVNKRYTWLKGAKHDDV